MQNSWILAFRSARPRKGLSPALTTLSTAPCRLRSRRPFATATSSPRSSSTPAQVPYPANPAVAKNMAPKAPKFEIKSVSLRIHPYVVCGRRMANWTLAGPLRAPETVRCHRTPRPPSPPRGRRRRVDESNTTRRVRPGHGAQGEDLQDNHRCLQYVWTGRPSRGTRLTKGKERHGGITIDTPVFELKGR